MMFPNPEFVSWAYTLAVGLGFHIPRLISTNAPTRDTETYRD